MPDNDIAGERYAKAVYKALKVCNPTIDINVINLPNLPEKGDFVDYLQSIPELSEWDGFKPLSKAVTETVKNPFAEDAEDNQFQYIQNKICTAFTEYEEAVPATWTYIETKSKHRVIAFNNFKRLDLPPRQLLLNPWLQDKSINMVFADRGIGKTFFSLSCAVALANGTDFITYSAPNPVSVLYLDGERCRHQLLMSA